MNRVHGYLLTAAPLRPVDATTGAAVSLDSMPKNVALGRTTLRIDGYEWGVTYAGMLQATQYHGRPALPLLRENQPHRARAHGGTHAGQLSGCDR